jgi:RHS repeat-associated protein
VLYAPFGEVITEHNAYWHNGLLHDYMFNAKELDEESGMYYYEARYYAPPTFISRDPHFESYPTMSPYAYCANNPVKYIDPTGKDFDPVIDHKKKTITINAVYYTSNENRRELKGALRVWNRQSGKYKYEVGEGNNKETYKIKFNLKVSKEKFASRSEAREGFYQALTNKNNKANFFEGSSLRDPQKQGSVTNGKIIKLNPRTVTDRHRTLAHEIGHTLGLHEWSSGLMESGGYSKKISLFYIQEMFSTFGFGNYHNIDSKTTPIQSGHQDYENFWSERFENWDGGQGLENGRVVR